ncbi:unnamed protein product [Meloidogyne enterolobii]|uniref:Uncharacterized protein n=1 Tax=Meloidogyne enterolobii TaxID=390850 RepID=A0ACB1B6Z7_MELEN
MLPMGRYLRITGLIFVLNSISIAYGRHHYMNPDMPPLAHQNQHMFANKHTHAEADHQMIGNKRPRSELENPAQLDGPHSFVRKTNKKRKIVENPKIMLVIWGANNEIIDDPHIMLRHMEKGEGLVSNAEHLPRTELTPLIDCSEDPPENGIPTEHCHYDLHVGNGITNITFRNPEIKGKVEISYALNEESKRISYIEDIENLNVAKDQSRFFVYSLKSSNLIILDHSAQKDLHQKHDPNSEDVDHRNILHLSYHNFKPYTYIYHIHGIIFWRGSDKENHSPVPLVANEGCAHVEYDIDHDHSFGNMPYEFYYDKVTGNFRITIKNGYGLDPLRKNEQNYGSIRIAVAYNKESFRIKERRVYTFKIADYLRDSHDNFEKAANHAHTEKKPSRILYLWADKEKMKYGPFPLHQREYSLEFKIKNNMNGNACDKPFSSAPMNWNKWLKIRDEDDGTFNLKDNFIIYIIKFSEEILSVDSTKIEHQSDGVLIAQVKLRKTIAEGFQLHIDCGEYKADYVMKFNKVADKSDWTTLESKVETNPELRVKYVDQSDQPQKSQFELRYKYSGRGEHPLMEEEFGVNNQLPNNQLAYPQDFGKNNKMSNNSPAYPQGENPSHSFMKGKTGRFHKYIDWLYSQRILSK